MSYGRVAPDDVRCHLERVRHRGCRFEAEPPDGAAIPADDDYGTEMLERVRAPVPHVEGVHPVVGVAGAVEMYVPGVGGEGLLVLADARGVGRLGEHLLEEIDVAR